MEHYSSRSGKASGVTAYELGDDFIRVQFRGNKVYKYSHNSAGEDTVNTMKRLANNQGGLSTFISQNKPGFE